jgi:uncharacterized protein
MITKAEILSKLTELKPILYKDYAVKEIGLFGSYCDNSNTEESDIDILIELENQLVGNFSHWNYSWRMFSTKN